MTKIFNIFSWLVLGAILATSFCLMVGASRGDSAIMDELAHIPAGYSYVRYFDFRLNPEHPPLVKAISALPLLFLHLNFPLNQASWISDINGQWVSGTQFLYESGNNADDIIFWARMGSIFLTLLLIYFVYFWAKELVGRWWGFLPAFLVAFSPIFLAHGHYVTTDIGASLGILIASYAFLKFIMAPTKNRLVWTGLAFGVAQLMKFSAVFLIPFFCVIVAVYYFKKVARNWRSLAIQGQRKRVLVWLWRDAISLAAIFTIGFFLVYLIYLLFTWNYPMAKQVIDTKTTLGSFGLKFLADLDIWMAGNSIFRPFAQYMLGVLMVLQRSAGGNTSYFLGEVSAVGSRLYFPTVFLMKETLPTLIILTTSLLLTIINLSLTIFRKWKNLRKIFGEYLETNFVEFSFLVFIIIYWAWSMKSPLNIGVRHIAPTLPFMYLLAVGPIKKWFAVHPLSFAQNLLEKLLNLIRNVFCASLKYSFLGILLLWLILGTFFAYPYYLSYFNELFGGTFSGYKYVTDSNFDWGQDLKRLGIWADANLGSNDKIAIDYFGGGNLKYYLGNRAEGWWSSRGNPKEDGINWLAVSINTIQGATAKTHEGFIRKPEDEYLWLSKPNKPTAKVGTSIFIYKL